jgi:hypothetical protein
MLSWPPASNANHPGDGFLLAFAERVSGNRGGGDLAGGDPPDLRDGQDPPHGGDFPRGRGTPFESPAVKLRFDATGRLIPSGNTVTSPADVGLTAVTFSTTPFDRLQPNHPVSPVQPQFRPIPRATRHSQRP